MYPDPNFSGLVPVFRPIRNRAQEKKFDPDPQKNPDPKQLIHCCKLFMVAKLFAMCVLRFTSPVKSRKAMIVHFVRQADVKWFNNKCSNVVLRVLYGRQMG